MASLKIAFILAILLVGIFSTSLVNSQDSSTVDPTQFNCKKVMMIIAKKQLKVFGECMREHKAAFTDKDEYADKIQCVVKCALDKENLLDTDKQITSNSIQHFMDANVPKMFHEMGHMFVDNCKAEFDGKMDAADPTCKTYGEFVKCMQNTLADLC